MPNAVETLLSILDLEQLEQNLFRGISPQDGWQRVFGGQVIGQALTAAHRTVPDYTAHSMHAYFLRPGDPACPIVYEVDRIRDGSSFSTRRVVAIQHGEAIFSLAASFQKSEQGFTHQAEMPNAPPPEASSPEGEWVERLLPRLPEPMRAYWLGTRPIEIRPVDLSRYLTPEPRDPRQMAWMRASAPLPDDPALHQCVLAYASDFTLLDTALIAHGRVLFDPALMLASLDHSLWWHRAFRADEWLLYVQDSPAASGGRGFCRGSIFTRDGALVASVAQEGLIRVRRAAQ